MPDKVKEASARNGMSLPGLLTDPQQVTQVSVTVPGGLQDLESLARVQA